MHSSCWRWKRQVSQLLLPFLLSLSLDFCSRLLLRLISRYPDALFVLIISPGLVLVISEKMVCKLTLAPFFMAHNQEDTSPAVRLPTDTFLPHKLITLSLSWPSRSESLSSPRRFNRCFMAFSLANLWRQGAYLNNLYGTVFDQFCAFFGNTNRGRDRKNTKTHAKHLPLPNFFSANLSPACNALSKSGACPTTLTLPYGDLPLPNDVSSWGKLGR